VATLDLWSGYLCYTTGPRLKSQGSCYSDLLTPRSPVKPRGRSLIGAYLDILLTQPIEWSQRNTLPALGGVYVLSAGNSGDILYIGCTWASGGVKTRLREFHRSATTGKKSHTGGISFYNKGGVAIDDLSIRVHVREQGDQPTQVYRAYIAYVERLLIWEYAEQHNRLPKCNSE